MKRLLLASAAILFASVAQGQDIRVPASGSSGSGTVTSVTCPNATITTAGACNPLPAGGTPNDVPTVSGTSGALQDPGGLSYTGGTLQIGTGSNSGILFLDTTSGGGVNLFAGSSASTFSATLPDNTGTVAELNLAQSFTATQTLSNLTLSGITGSTQCLQVNTSGVVAGSTAACGGAPGGSNTQVQYNSGGAFAGSVGLTYTLNNLVIGSGAGNGILQFDNTSGGDVALAATSTASSLTATLPANTGTIAELNLAQTFSAAQTYSADQISTVAGAASAPAALFSGSIFTGGNGTTTFPQLLIQPSTATPATTWSTTGTALGVNVHTGIANLIDLRIDGTQAFVVSSAGTVTAASGINAGTGTNISFSGRGNLTSPAAGAIQLGLGDNSAPVAQTLSVQSVVAGTSNTAGAATLITGSRSTGSGAGGSITLQTSLNTAAATTQNTLANVLTLDGVQHGTFGNTGAPPTCGAGCASISATSTDQRMVVTTGTAATSVVVNFGKTWVNAPVCVSETASATNLSGITAISASSVTIGVATALTTAPIYIVCG